MIHLVANDASSSSDNSRSIPPSLYVSPISPSLNRTTNNNNVATPPTPLQQPSLLVKESSTSRRQANKKNVNDDDEDEEFEISPAPAAMAVLPPSEERGGVLIGDVVEGETGLMGESAAIAAAAMRGMDITTSSNSPVVQLRDMRAEINNRNNNNFGGAGGGAGEARGGEGWEEHKTFPIDDPSLAALDEAVRIRTEELEAMEEEAIELEKAEFVSRREEDIASKLNGAISRLEAQVDNVDIDVQKRKEMQQVEASNDSKTSSGSNKGKMAHVSEGAFEEMEGYIRQMRAEIEAARLEVRERGFTPDKLVVIHTHITNVKGLVDKTNTVLDEQKWSCSLM